MQLDGIKGEVKPLCLVCNGAALHGFHFCSKHLEAISQRMIQERGGISYARFNERV